MEPHPRKCVGLSHCRQFGLTVDAMGPWVAHTVMLPRVEVAMDEVDDMFVPAD